MAEFPVRLPKRLLAHGLDLLGANEWFLRSLNRRFRGRYIRAVNYHDVPMRLANEFERQLEYFETRFSPVTLGDLDAFLRSGSWEKDKPGLILSFDDGLRSSYSVVAPQLSRRGWTGWFFVPTDFIDAPPARQREFTLRHGIVPLDIPPDGRIALTWDEIKELGEEHVIGSHTRTHHWMHGDTKPLQLKAEIRESKAILEEHLGRAIDAFCWVGGDESSYSREAAAVIRESGYRFSFMTNSSPINVHTDGFHLNRTNLEAYWPMEIIRFQVSGIMDLIYRPKRHRVNRLTS